VGAEMVPYYQDVYDHVLRATEWTESLRDLVTTILETNLTICCRTALMTVETPLIVSTGVADDGTTKGAAAEGNPVRWLRVVPHPSAGVKGTPLALRVPSGDSLAALGRP
ncbi:MAG: hypothetical protein ACRDZY_03255, partial [Acidimicrobiales bacterium]